MIVINGEIMPITYEGGGTDSKGCPVQAQEVEHCPIPCNIQTTMRNHKGVTESGTYSSQAYTILVDDQCWCADWVRLRDNQGNTLGKFRVQDIQRLEFVGALQLKIQEP